MISDRYRNDGKATLKLNSLQLQTRQLVQDKISSGRYQFEPVGCPVCYGNDFQQLAEKDRYGLYCANVVCRDCGLVMINPRMTGSSYAEFYDQEYRPLYTGKSANAANFFQAQKVRGHRLYNYMLERDLLPSINEPLVIEVGCGAGGILSFFKTRGFKVKGIDLGREYLEYGKENHRLDLTVGTIHQLELDRSPDLIIYSHVMEHIAYPNSELERLFEICSEKTLIYVEVPGIKNLSLGYRKDPLRYFQNAHTFSFSLTTLNNLFTRQGFTKICGDEFVKAVFKKGQELSFQLVNDFQHVLAYLNAAEKDRKFYAISRARFQVLRTAISNHIAGIVKR